MSDLSYKERYLQAAEKLQEATERLQELKALMQEVELDDYFCQNNPDIIKQWNDALEEDPKETADKPAWLMAPRKHIWFVWCAEVGGSLIKYYLRSVCSNRDLAELHKKTVKDEIRIWRQEERRIVVVEENLTNHLYAENDMRVAGESPRGNVP
jgi:hypothetical protein